MRFRSALLLGFVALVTLLLAATFVAVAVVLERAARREVAHELAAAAKVLDVLEREQEARLGRETRLLAEEPRLKALVATAAVSHATIFGVAKEMQRALDGSLFLLVDARGTLLVDVDVPAANGFDLAADPIVAATLARGSGAGVWTRDQQVYQVHGRTMTVAGTTVGAVLFGYPLDEAFARRVATQSSTTAALELDGRAIAQSPLADGRRLADPTVLAAIPTSAAAPSEVTLGGARYLAVAVPLPGYHGRRALRYVLLSSLDRALAPSRHLVRVLFAILGLGLVVALLLASLLARRLARPVDELVSFVAAIGSGDPTVRAAVRGPVEWRVLAGAMNRMVGELASSREQLVAKERLERELELAASIQTSILPRQLSLRRLEIAAAMIPATEVGGDYYDVLPFPGGGWIGIGDVAGHGLGSGLIMLMLQSALSALAKAPGQLPPQQVVALLNRVLYENVRQRLLGDHHVTFSLLQYHEDGRVIVAGAHEELIICPGDGGPCRREETPGAWLGVRPDITQKTVERTHQLRDGDILILHTDGVTEAMNAAGEQLGPERLCAIVEAARRLPVEVIRDRVISAVRQWTAVQDDDVTLLVLRYRTSTLRTAA